MSLNSKHIKDSVYVELDNIIKELEKLNFKQLSTTFNHRIYKIAWTTRTELFDEIRSVLKAENIKLLPQELKTKIEEVLKKLV
jgi:hypothetical protein